MCMRRHRAARFALAKDFLQAIRAANEIEGQILDLPHCHFHGTGPPANVGMSVICDPVRAGRRRTSSKKQDALAGTAANLDPPDS